MNSSDCSNSLLLINENSEDVQEVHIEKPFNNCIYLITSDESSSDVCILEDSSDAKIYHQNDANKLFTTIDKVPKKQSRRKKKCDIEVNVPRADFRNEVIESRKISKATDSETRKQSIQNLFSRLKNCYNNDSQYFYPINGGSRKPELNTRENALKYDVSLEKESHTNVSSLKRSDFVANKTITSDKVAKKQRKKKKCDIEINDKNSDFSIEEIQSRKKRKAKEKESSELDNCNENDVKRFLDRLRNGSKGETNNFSLISNGHIEVLDPSEITDKDSGNGSISDLEVNDIFLLAWHIEIEKQESKIRDLKKKKKRKRKRCDCKMVYQTLVEDDYKCETVLRINYSTRFTCCQFRKAIFGNSYYVPSSCYKKKKSKQNKTEFNQTISSTDNTISYGVNSSNDDHDKSLGNVDSFDKLIELEFNASTIPPQSRDNGYCSESSKDNDKIL